VPSRYDEKALSIFERKVLRFGPKKDGSKWRIRYSCDLCSLYEVMDIITSVELDRLKWAGRVVRMDCSDMRKEFLMPDQKAAEKGKKA
jgi:hypothetical protein